MPLSLTEFVRRWKISSRTERSAAQEQFLNICEMLEEPTPAASDEDGSAFTFEKHVAKTRGGKGFADVWRRGFFAWEYKGEHKDLTAAYHQLLDYREDLLNPPLLVVSDMKRFLVHTNWTNTAHRVYEFNLDDLERNVVTATCPLPPVEVLRALFDDTSVLRPDRTAARVTEEVAKKFTKMAERLELEHQLDAKPQEIAHFLMRILFCLFADSIGLLPKHVFRNLALSEDRFQPKRFLRKLEGLFAAMSEPDGIFGEHTIHWFNGGLFNDARVLPLTKEDLAVLNDVSRNYDWSHIAPAIFGTLFERSLDPARRSQIGAHYTSETDISLLIEPVMMQPLRQRWAEVRARVDEQLTLERAAEESGNRRQARLRPERESQRVLNEWAAELTRIRVLDPACGSGNFLYVALRNLLDLWYEVHKFGIDNQIPLLQEDMVTPRQLYGIETNLYAHELASVVVWIGYLQWKHEHVVPETKEPILQKLDNIQHADAILRYGDDGKPYEPQWPAVDFIVSNPPFLGGKMLRRELTDKYVDNLFAIYAGRVRAESDLVCYWFDKSWQQLAAGKADRVGLVATQAIRGGANRDVLRRISRDGSIFFAITDKKWLLPGAAVHVSMVGFERETATEKSLDGEAVTQINADLTSGVDLTVAQPLEENTNICFMGTTKVGDFDLEPTDAVRMLGMPRNPNGRPNSDVIKPWLNARDITGRLRGFYIIDFGVDTSEREAAMYQAPFEFLRTHVKPGRENNRRGLYAERWWLHGEPRRELRNAIAGKRRIILTPAVSKHRLFVWTAAVTIPDHAVFTFARDDDYFFGVLHSSAHEMWARGQGTQLREVESGFRYTPRSCFDTFPFPWPPGSEPSEAHSPVVREIAEAARELVRRRDAWLNPPDATDEQLEKRTLTNLYNESPAFLTDAHARLDRAVLAAYGWPSNLTHEQILGRLLALNQERAAVK